MKKEQRQVLDELEKQLSSLISEKEKLEERQVTSTDNTKLTRRNRPKESKAKKKALVCNSPRFFFSQNFVITCRKIVKASYHKFKIQH